MSTRGILITLAISATLAAYLFYGLIPIPSDIKQKDDVFWVFAKRKLLRGLSTAGEYLGFGHRITVVRSLATSKLLSLTDSPDYTDVKAVGATFEGIPVRVYEPNKRVSRSPAFIWFHGGGWTTGSAEGDEAFTVELARRLNILVISVNHRLAPEFVFPTPFDDCVTATIYFLKIAAEKYNVDSSRVAIGGSSSGANLAAAVSLKLRDIANPIRPSIQVLIVPCLQALDFNTPSYQQNTNNAFLPKYWMINFWLWYAHGPNGHTRAFEYLENRHTSPAAKTSKFARYIDHNFIDSKSKPAFYVPNVVDTGNETLWNDIRDVFLNPYFAPLMAEDLHGLPEAYVATAGWDVLRDDGVMYAKRLAADGEVNVEHNHYEHGFHALFMRFDHYELSKRFTDDLVQYLAQRL